MNGILYKKFILELKVKVIATNIITSSKSVVRQANVETILHSSPL